MVFIDLLKAELIRFQILGFIEIFVSGNQTVFEKQVTIVNAVPTGVIEKDNVYAVSGGDLFNRFNSLETINVEPFQVTSGVYLRASDGELISSGTVGRFASHYSVKEGEIYTYTGYNSATIVALVGFYDNTDTYLGYQGLATSSLSEQTIEVTIPANCVVAKISYIDTGQGYSFTIPYVKENYIDFDTENKVELQESKNAFVASSAIDGYYLNPYSDLLIESSNDCYSKEYVSVKEGDVLRGDLNYGELNFAYVFYNEAKVYVSGGLFTSTVTEKTVPSGVAYVRTSCKIVNKLVKYVSINTTENKYIKGGKFIEESIEYASKSMFNGMVYNSVGDSITAQQKWQGYLIGKYGLEWRNKGLGGQTLSGSTGAMWYTSFEVGNSLAIDDDIDLVTLNFGANDWGQNKVIGSQTSTDETEILGAFNSYVNSFYTKFPDKILIVIGTTLCADTGVFTNSLGYTTRDISEAIKERCAYFGIPFADVISNYGVNEYNHTTFTPDEIHPNDLGAERMAGVIIGTMESIDNYKN